jgi:formate dehydrogenase assembly factor FdhD
MRREVAQNGKSAPVEAAIDRARRSGLTTAVDARRINV